VLDEVGVVGAPLNLEPHMRKRKAEDTVEAAQLQRVEALYSRLMERALHLD